MKKFLFLLTIAISCNELSFCQETQNRNLESFTRIHISESIDAVIQKGSGESVKIVVKGISASRIITEVSDHDLHIYVEDGDFKNFSVKVYIIFKDITSVDKSGTGTLDSPFELSAPDFNLTVSGSGSCAFGGKLKVPNLKITKSGSAEIKLHGVETNNIEMVVSGSGTLAILDGVAVKSIVQLSGNAIISTPGFKSEECSATISGTGNAEVSVSKKIEGILTGAGNLIYNGNAEIVKKTITGFGKITKRS